MDKQIKSFFCWNEFVTDNIKEAKAFYTELFSWTATTDVMASNGVIHIINAVQISNINY